MGLLQRMLFLLLIATAAELLGGASAATYVVGDNLGGWTIPSGGAAAYANWASGRAFVVGDVLVFNFTTGVHDVAETTKAAYDSCSSTNPIRLITTGPANITLNSPGEHHFICTFGQHCTFGQKLAINVSTSITPAPAPSPSPTPPSPSPSPSLAPTPTPSPSPSSSPSPSPSPTPSNSPSPSPASSPSSSPSPSPVSSPSPSPASSPSPSPASSPSPTIPSAGPGSGASPGSTPSDAGLSPPAPPSGGAASLIATTGFSLAATCVAVFYGIVMM